MRSLLSLLLLCSAAAFAQEEPVDTSDPARDDAPSMMRPASDSPEAIRTRKYDGPRHRAQAFLIPMDEGARHPTTRVATAVEMVLLHTPLYEVVDLGHALSVESTVEQAQKADEGRRLVAGGNASAAAKGWPEAAANQIIAGASDEVGRGTAGRNVSALAEKFSLERVLIGSVRSQEESRVSVVLALVDAVHHRIIAAKTLALSVDGTDADQIELETQAAARKLVAADDAGAEMAESKAAADPPAPASKEAVKKKKSQGLQGKTGTEGWGDD